MLSFNRLVLAGLALAVVLAPAGAQAVTNPVVDLGSGYACEGTRAVDDHTSTAADDLVIVGHVVDFNDPFDDLDPNDPTKEYTYVYSGMTSVGSVVIPAGLYSIYNTNYNGGVLRIYCDAAMDADYSDKDTFSNGDMILEVSLENFRTSTNTNPATQTCAGSQNADITGFTGGSLASRLAGYGCGIITGAFSACSGTVGANAALGYFGWSDTKVDADCPVPLEQKTWGGIKSLYDN